VVKNSIQQFLLVFLLLLEAVVAEMAAVLAAVLADIEHQKERLVEADLPNQHFH
jgi:hypothetical protein